MAGMSMSNAIILYTTPTQLSFTILHKKKSDTYGFYITQGPDRDYRPVLTAEPFHKSHTVVLEALRTLLETARTVVAGEFRKECVDSVFDVAVSGIENLDPATLLTSEMINDIIAQLEEHGEANMYQKS